MFSGYIVAVSLALQILYGINDLSDTIGILSIVEGSLLVIIFIVYFILLIAVP